MTNDAFGHKMGDMLLKTSADILQGVTRTDDILGRIGGDEFMLILPQTNYKDAGIIKKRIIEKAKKTLLGAIVVSMAVGFEVKTNKDQSIDDIQRQADVNMYKDKFRNNGKMRSQTINNILKNIEKKCTFVKDHQDRVTEYSIEIAKELNLERKTLEEIEIATFVHDVGKITISADILNKKEKLTNEEWEEIKKHPVIGYNLLKASNEYAGIAEYVLYHHERFDGKGYPKGLKGEEIPLISRILTVADSYEAMISPRPYKKTKSKEEAINELIKCSGKQFSPEIVDIFIKVLKREVIDE